MAAVSDVQNRLRRTQWEALRLMRALQLHVGWGVLAGGTAVLATVALVIWSFQLQANVEDLSARIEHERRTTKPRQAPPSSAQRLDAFYKALPAAEEIPTTVSRLIGLAEEQHLLLLSAEYRATPDGPGRYLRYRIVLPVSGDASAVQEFMLAALREHRALALESVTFKRERIEAKNVEARIQFALITRAPTASTKSTAEASS
jgi:hypothetical protein